MAVRQLPEWLRVDVTGMLDKDKDGEAIDVQPVGFARAAFGGGKISRSNGLAIGVDFSKYDNDKKGTVIVKRFQNAVIEADDGELIPPFRSGILRFGSLADVESFCELLLESVEVAKGKNPFAAKPKAAAKSGTTKAFDPTKASFDELEAAADTHWGRVVEVAKAMYALQGGDMLQVLRQAFIEVAAEATPPAADEEQAKLAALFGTPPPAMETEEQKVEECSTPGCTRPKKHVGAHNKPKSKVKA